MYLIREACVPVNKRRKTQEKEKKKGQYMMCNDRMMRKIETAFIHIQKH
jgi:hypothetical protein